MKETIQNLNIENQEVVTEIVAEKPYTFRRLGAEDVFPMVAIIKKIGIKEFKAFFEGEKLEAIKAAFSGGDGKNNVEQAGISIFLELLDILLSNLPNCENDIFLLLSNTSNLTVEEVRKLELGAFTEMIFEFFKKDEFKDFIKVVSKLFK